MRKFWIRRFRFHCLISWTWYTYFFGLSKSTILSKFSYCVTCNPVEFHKCCECWTLVPNHPHFHHQHEQFVTTFLGGCVTYTSSISSPQISSDHKLIHQRFFFCPTDCNSHTVGKFWKNSSFGWTKIEINRYIKFMRSNNESWIYKSTNPEFSHKKNLLLTFSLW